MQAMGLVFLLFLGGLACLAHELRNEVVKSSGGVKK